MLVIMTFFLVSREVPSFDELEPEPKPLPNCPFLN
ncbi:hypothetical protein Tco_0541733, partial [Tanacetum coccineum]